MSVEIAWFSRPRAGERVCGDGVGSFGEGDDRLLAVADGLGHGPEAHRAAQQALDFLRDRWREEPVADLIQGCHDHVRGTRGLALFLGRWRGADGVLECVGVGNVELRVHGRNRSTAFSKAGVVGGQLGRPAVMQQRLAPGDVASIYTDGVEGRFDLKAFGGKPAEEVARAIVDGWGKDADDATVLVIRV